MGAIFMSDLPPRREEQKVQPLISITMSDIEDRGRMEQRKKIRKSSQFVGNVLKDGQWKGQRCFIVAGGQSVNDFDLKQLEGENVIGVNLAFRLVECSIIYAMDARLWGWIENNLTGPGDKEKFDASQAIKVWSDINDAPLPEDIYIAPAVNRQGLSESFEDGIGAGTNSGFGALNLALILGASEIYLIGFDFYGDRWHAGYPEQGQADNAYHRTCFEENSEEYKKFSSRIINLNPKSDLKIFEFGEMPKGTPVQKVVRVKRENEPIFVSYYTPENGYKRYADNLKKTLKRLDLDHDIQAVKSKGSWDLDTKYKAEFLSKMLDKHEGRDVVWIDVDAVVVSEPIALLENKNQADIKIHYRDGHELLSGLIYLANNEKTRGILFDWKKECKTAGNETVWDQVLLQKVLEDVKKKAIVVTVEQLAAEYAYIIGLNNPDVEPIIEQHQASRELKR